MLKFYFSKNSSAIAAHILLEEIGASYDPVEVPVAKAAHLAPAYLKVNPKGRIPALETEHGVITENPAILEYIAATHRDAGILPEGPFADAKARELCAYICATAHVAFAHGHRGARWASDAASHKDMQAMMPDNLRDCAAFLEGDLALGPWALGAQYSYCDPYLFLIDRMLEISGVQTEDYPKLAAHRDAMLARPATQRVLALYASA